MTIDLIVHAPNKATLVAWAEAHPANSPLRQEVGAVYDTDPESPTFGDKLQEGTMQNRPGFTYCWWTGSGEMERQREQFRVSRPVAIVQGGRFGFTIPGNLPAWVDSETTARDADGNIVGTYDGQVAGYAAFVPTGALPAVGDDLDIWSGRQTIAGVVAILRFSGEFFNEDKLDAAEDEEQWMRSRIAGYIKNNGAAIKVLGINGYEMDNVKLFRPQDVMAKVSEWDVYPHQYQGGNRF